MVNPATDGPKIRLFHEQSGKKTEYRKMGEKMTKDEGMLREETACAPVLAAPNFFLPFKLEVDASATGAGAVLLQDGEGGVCHPVCYFSTKFKRHRLNYSRIEKETLAMLLTLQHFEVYVGSSSSPVTVYTDHNPLVFLSQMYNHNQRLMHWALLAQGYNLDIKHKRGVDNVVADALFRG
ncbi:hypothetical protein L3Q82_019571 [Scortum barcoo]|uniref:Uncharacterized protein n=1 Tax=Scortum barcoo TaxID=214431 RepID=A0ACB8VBU5_9TELE|nr:hypothetical protein L3Q82_019571 [Scortum barcoo]